MNSEYKQSAIGKDFLQAKNSFNYPRDNYLIQGSGSYYQLSERNFIKARKGDDGAPTEIRDPNTTYEWAKNKPETTYDKMAKAHFKEQDRRKYEEERNKNINMRGTKEQISIIPEAPLPPSTNSLAQQLQNVRLRDGLLARGNDILAQINQAQNQLDNIDIFEDAPEDIFADAGDVLEPPNPPQQPIPPNPLGAQIRGQRRNLRNTPRQDVNTQLNAFFNTLYQRAFVNDYQNFIKKNPNAKLGDDNTDWYLTGKMSDSINKNLGEAGPSSSPVVNRTRSKKK